MHGPVFATSRPLSLLFTGRLRPYMLDWYTHTYLKNRARSCTEGGDVRGLKARPLLSPRLRTGGDFSEVGVISLSRGSKPSHSLSGVMACET